jgi:hypothetical protein
MTLVNVFVYTFTTNPDDSEDNAEHYFDIRQLSTYSKDRKMKDIITEAIDIGELTTNKEFPSCGKADTSLNSLIKELNRQPFNACCP